METNLISRRCQREDYLEIYFIEIYVTTSKKKSLYVNEWDTSAMKTEYLPFSSAKWFVCSALTKNMNNTDDEDGIRTHACRAHWISSPTP